MAKIVDVIKYEGDNSTFIWKHPEEDFNSLSQLIVHENQEAIFFMNGQALDLFGPGRYTLETQNIPLIGKVLKRFTGDTSPFHCEVYFINKTEQMSIKWGTDTRVQYMEPTYNFPISIGASGEMCLRVEESRKLLLKIVGTEDNLTQQKISSYFRAFLMTKIKTYIAQVIKAHLISIFEIDERLSDFSKDLQALLAPDFADYGISLERFFVTAVAKPDGEEQYEKFKELHFRQYADIAEAKIRQQSDIIYAQTEAQKIVIDSQAQATKREQEKYSYAQERGFDVAEKVAQNEAIGQFTNMGVGLGTMVGVGGAVGGLVGGVVNDAINSADYPSMVQLNRALCAACGADIPAGVKFCPKCGEKVTSMQLETTICPHCGNTVSKEKFCQECGRLLIAVCSNCGHTVPDGAKFCLECGQKL